MALPDWSDDNLANVAPVLDQGAAMYGLPRDIVYGLVSQESRFNPSAIGDNGRARGLTQLWLTTAQSMGYGGDADSLLDPVTNVTWGLLYLRSLLDRFGGDMNVALSAYNGGYKNGTITNPNYVNAVIDRAQYFDQLWAGGGFQSDPTMLATESPDTTGGVSPLVLWLAAGAGVAWLVFRGGR